MHHNQYGQTIRNRGGHPLGTFLQKLGEGKGWKFAIAIVTGAVAFLTLQDSRPHVLFGTVIVKHLLDLISSCPQPVHFLRFDFGEAHRGRAIRIQSGGNQRFVIFKLS